MRVNLIPLAGRGKRFANEGYSLPKPLITINGVPMVVAAAKSLPNADLNVFICLKDHIVRYNIDKIIKKYFVNAVVIPVGNVTEGQAKSCLMAENYIDPNAELIIGACDNGMVFSQIEYDKEINDSSTDALVWTFRNNPNVKRHPEHWGWVAVDRMNNVKKISVKIPLSEDHSRDHAVVGCFSFKKAKNFFAMAKKMIADNRRINSEFYNDECMNVLIENGYRVRVFEIEIYIGWGTPDDLRIYEYWNSYYKKVQLKTDA